MSLIAWNEKMSVGIESIDTQHQRLLQSINDFHEACAGGPGRPALKALLDKVMFYINDHFQYEEEMLRSHGYEGLEDHIMEHRMLSAQAEGYLERYENGQDPDADELVEFLKAWWTNHIMRSDREYGNVLAPG